AGYDGELPKVAQLRRQHERPDEQDRPDRRREPRAEPIERQADERTEDAVEEEAHRDHEREARAVETEVGHDRLEEWPHGVADSGGDERHEGESGDDPPAVEHRSAFHVSPTILGLATYRDRVDQLFIRFGLGRGFD